MSIDNIKSGADYSQLIMDNIIKTEKELPTNEQMPISMLSYVAEEVGERADRYYQDYITGKRESFLFDEDDITEMFKKAHESFVSETLNGMVDKGLLEVSVGENGDILYGLSDEGKETAKKLFGDEK